ncbi:hypothetical protein MKX01_039608 [Papaver californicum]|nr:hypothetical protein MKX01_039608 [Papaver californicum]
MEKNWLVIVALLLFQIIQTTQAENGSSSNSKLKDAYTALQSWKSAITDDPLGVLKTWVGNNVCSYNGVFCGNPQNSSLPSDLVVVGIDLNFGNLQGTLVKELSLLADIILIHLNSNRFTKNVPGTFQGLLYLAELDLSNNLFSGSFPSVVLSLPRLVYLDLRFNEFSGPIPDNLFSNKRLDAVFLNNNQFVGRIPSSLGNSKASVITFANNNFSGDIPASIGNMGASLKEVLFLNNQLNGCIPEGIGRLTEMKVLDISVNSFMGQLPNSLSCLKQIEVLNLGHNKLSGVLSDTVCSLTSIVNLTVSGNFFSGISPSCKNLSSSGNSIGCGFTANCLPGLNQQRSQPECSLLPSGMNCIQIPLITLLRCG